ncbi:MAG: HEAT repeat domain-containing protein, partial [Fuerstiella sp.]|nr:HEAT repeat domain-containing protein [Fuerstiella sp.]
MLPNAGLKPAYDKAVWMYVYRDFTQSPADVKAERVSLRLSVTSWPQLVLVDPDTVEVVGSTGRTEDTFLRAVDRAAARVRASETSAAADRIADADARAAELESSSNVRLARRYLDDDDIVVRYRALHVLAEKDPKFVAKQAVALLQVPNDTFRYDVCTTLGTVGRKDARGALESLVRNPVHSRNPNVLRIRAVSALATCGNRDSVSAIRPLTRGSYLNGLTGTAIKSVVEIAKSDPTARAEVRQILIESFPQQLEETPVHARYCLALAKTVNAALADVTGKQQ